MNNNLKIEVLYNSRKKSMAVAYAIGLVFGGIGGSYFYCGREDLGFTVIALLVLSIIVPAVSPIFMIIVLGGFIHTAYVVDEANRNIKRECEILCKE